MKRTYLLLITALWLTGVGGGALADAPPKLQRSDFRVSGASCVACLRKLGKLLRKQEGVLKADISIFKPHWGVIIYDRGKTSMDKLYKTVRSEEKVTFEEVTEQKLDAVPKIIIPKGIAFPSSDHLESPATAKAAH